MLGGTNGAERRSGHRHCIRLFSERSACVHLSTICNVEHLLYRSLSPSLSCCLRKRTLRLLPLPGAPLFPGAPPSAFLLVDMDITFAVFVLFSSTCTAAVPARSFAARRGTFERREVGTHEVPVVPPRLVQCDTFTLSAASSAAHTAHRTYSVLLVGSVPLFGYRN